MNALVPSISVGLALIAVERVAPAVPGTATRNWLPRALALNLCQVAVVVLAGYTWNVWLRGPSILHASLWPDGLAALATYVVSTFIFYWWHRIRHESPFWWRVAHQIHHSASRIEILTSFYKHPIEIMINSVLSAVLVYPIMGCSAVQGGYYTLLIALGEMIYHWNIHTPRGMGIWFQRPESHRIHHQRDRHTKNYSDLPVWDILFGTFSNPRNGDRVPCGFASDRETRLGAMLLLREVDSTRISEPLSFRPACLGCTRRHRCRSNTTHE